MNEFSIIFHNCVELITKASEGNNLNILCKRWFLVSNLDPKLPPPPLPTPQPHKASSRSKLTRNQRQIWIRSSRKPSNRFWYMRIFLKFITPSLLQTSAFTPSLIILTLEKVKCGFTVIFASRTLKVASLSTSQPLHITSQNFGSCRLVAPSAKFRRNPEQHARKFATHKLLVRCRLSYPNGEKNFESSHP